MNSTYLLLGIILIAGFSVIIFLLTRKKEETDTKSMSILNDSLNNVTKTLFVQLNEVTKQVGARLKENADVLQQSNKTVGERLDNAAKVVNTVTDRLSKLEEANKKIYDVGKDIASLQEILRAPKLRGGLGELFLGDLLAQYFPKEQYEMQYSFKSGEQVDAVIKLRDDRIVPIDSKFPLENFQKMMATSDETEKKGFKRTFNSDVKKHIDSIAKKYILPDEGTLDFALMYVHAENVYYEVMTRDEENIGLYEYAMKKRVMPVSPNNFFIYIQTILFGLRGLEIEKSAKNIQKNLSQLKTDFIKFGDDFQVLGTHLGNAQSKYEQSEKRLVKFTDRLEKVHIEGENTPLLEMEQEKGSLEKESERQKVESRK